MVDSQLGGCCVKQGPASWLLLTVVCLVVCRAVHYAGKIQRCAMCWAYKVVDLHNTVRHLWNLQLIDSL